MPRLYALQQRLAITSAEATALLFVSVLLFTGFCVRYEQGRSVPFSAAHYAELDDAFAERTASLRTPAASDSTGAAEPVRVVAATTETRPTPRRAVQAGPVRMNLNTASERMLQRLPGVGPKIAARIADYRAAHGGFRTPGEITYVKGIGPKTFEKLEPYLFVDEGEDRKR